MTPNHNCVRGQEDNLHPLHLLGLPIPLLILYAFHPGHPEHGQHKETIHIIYQPNESDIPCLKCSQKLKEPAGFDDRLIWFHWTVVVNVANTKQKEVDGDCNKHPAKDKTEVDFNMHRTRRKVKINQPYCVLLMALLGGLKGSRGEGRTNRNRPSES